LQVIRVIVKRLLATIPLLFLITIGTFLLAQAIQGNPPTSGPSSTSTTRHQFVMCGG
jgi:ABC-type dipeptide/oligopeptide/nickel transport system permease component